MRRFIKAAAFFFLCGIAQTAAAQQTYVPGNGDAWYGSTGTIMLTRENPRDVLIGSSPAGADIGYRTSLIDFGPKFGIETVVGRRFAAGDGFEGRFFDVQLGTGIPDFFPAAPGIRTAFNNNDINSTNGINNATVARTAYQSSLKNLELNYRAPATESIGIIGGLRYLDLSEQLQIGYTNAARDALNIQEISSHNELWGGQLGMDALLYNGDWLSVSTFGKSGVFYNEAQNGVQKNFRNAVSNTIHSARGADDELSFVFESGLNVAVQVTQRLTFQTGYNLMWLDGVALASDQIAVSNPLGGGTVQGVNPTQISQVDTRNLFLHGLTLSLTYAW